MNKNFVNLYVKITSVEQHKPTRTGELLSHMCCTRIPKNMTAKFVAYINDLNAFNKSVNIVFEVAEEPIMAGCASGIITNLGNFENMYQVHVSIGRYPFNTANAAENRKAEYDKWNAEQMDKIADSYGMSLSDDYYVIPEPHRVGKTGNVYQIVLKDKNFTYVDDPDDKLKFMSMKKGKNMISQHDIENVSLQHVDVRIVPFLFQNENRRYYTTVEFDGKNVDIFGSTELDVATVARGYKVQHPDLKLVEL